MPKKRDGEITLHPKYGVNPTMPVCAWCGKPTGEIALLGASYKDRSPGYMILNDEPCAACRARMKHGITLVEFENDRPGAKRTGRWCVVKREVVERMLTDPELREGVIKAGRAAITPDVGDAMGFFEKEIN